MTRAITQEDVSRLLGREPRRGEGTLVKWLEEWMERREWMEPADEMERRTRG